MKNTQLYTTLLLAFALLVSSAMPASASLLGMKADASVNANGRGASVKLDTAAKTRADREIDARIASLVKLQTRINEMKKISASDKASLTATLAGAVTSMTNLKAKIDADTDNATLKSDIQSITKSYRIYLLVLPQGRIMAAADRSLTTADLFADIHTKLAARIATAEAAGKDVTALKASLADMDAKAADAKAQAQGAIDLVANLKPDNGDKTIFQSNQTAFKNARTKIRAATADLHTARKDANSITRALAGMKIKANVNTSATAN
jgi:hypothetical protein